MQELYGSNLLDFSDGRAMARAPSLICDARDANIIADKGYDSAELRQQIRSQNCEPVIPTKSNNKNPIEYDEALYEEQHIIECFFSKIKYFRRIFSRFDKAARNYAAVLAFVGAMILLR